MVPASCYTETKRVLLCLRLAYVNHSNDVRMWYCGYCQSPSHESHLLPVSRHSLFIPILFSGVSFLFFDYIVCDATSFSYHSQTVVQCRVAWYGQEDDQLYWYILRSQLFIDNVDKTFSLHFHMQVNWLLWLLCCATLLTPKMKPKYLNHLWRLAVISGSALFGNCTSY